MRTLLEKLIVDSKSEPDSKKKVENTLSLLKIAMSDDIKEVQLFYSWILLDLMFYRVYKLKADDLKEVDFNTIDYKKTLGIEVSFTQFEEMRSKLKQAYQDSDSSSTAFSRSTFVTALHVFHTNFINWLPKNVDTFIGAELASSQIENETLTKVELKFPDLFPIVTEVGSGKSYPFTKRIVKTAAPYRIYSYCLSPDKQGKYVYFSEIIEKLELHKNDKRKRGVPECLRNSPFNQQQALGAFMKIEEDQNRIKAFKIADVNNEQLQKIVEASTKK
jgi:hypothetical protein